MLRNFLFHASRVVNRLGNKKMTKFFNNKLPSSFLITAKAHKHLFSQEKLATGIFMACGMMAIPAWVMLHIKEYKGQA